MTNNINCRKIEEKEKQQMPDNNSKTYNSFKELKEEFYKKKRIKKYWSKPVEKGIKNDIELL
jgi:hypothetical protein